VSRGKQGGLKGGPARARKLSPERRSAIARLGGQAKAKRRNSGLKFSQSAAPEHLYGKNGWSNAALSYGRSLSEPLITANF